MIVKKFVTILTLKGSLKVNNCLLEAENTITEVLKLTKSKKKTFKDKN